MSYSDQLMSHLRPFAEQDKEVTEGGGCMNMFKSRTLVRLGWWAMAGQDKL